MHEGIYEQAVTRAVEEALGHLSGLEPRTVGLDTGDGPRYLARLVAAEVLRVLANVHNVDEQARIANTVLGALREAAALAPDRSLGVASPERLLLEVHRHEVSAKRPETPERGPDLHSPAWTLSHRLGLTCGEEIGAGMLKWFFNADPRLEQGPRRGIP